MNENDKEIIKELLFYTDSLIKKDIRKPQYHKTRNRELSCLGTIITGVCGIMLEKKLKLNDRYLLDFYKFNGFVDEYIWLSTGRLYMFFVWYLTEVCEVNNIKAYKGKGSINFKVFERVIKVKGYLDRKYIQEFREIMEAKTYNQFPKGYKLICNVVDETINGFVVNFSGIL